MWAIIRGGSCIIIMKIIISIEENGVTQPFLAASPAQAQESVYYLIIISNSILLDNFQIKKEDLL